MNWQYNGEKGSKCHGKYNKQHQSPLKEKWSLVLEAETCQQSKLLSSALTQYSALIRVVYSKGNLPVTECRQSSRANVPTYAGVTFPGRFIFVLATLSRGVVCPERRATFKIWIPMRLWNAVGNIAIPTKTQMKSRVINGRAEIFANTRVNDVWRFLVGGEKWGGSPLIFIHGSLFATSFIIFYFLLTSNLLTPTFKQNNKERKQMYLCAMVLVNF